ncbi:HigA family addiction module antitoxin [Actinoplanes sp. NPDC051859]|uniref:HigA family addiction module antitoxin n=1 Tax=Actinoplanes sp. NPDC051859 TaxID=3363909 RepID=UPI0037911898
MDRNHHQASSPTRARSKPASDQRDGEESQIRGVRSHEGDTFAETGLSPDWQRPPGKMLQAELDARNITQAELAVRLNVSAKHVNQVIKGVASLTFDMALRLERTLGTPAAFWNQLEASYQDRRAREKARTEWARDHLGWLRRFPLPALVDRGVLVAGDSEITMLERLLAFFQVADPDAYQRAWAEPVAAGFRRTQDANVDPYATAAWLRLGERAADMTPCRPYDSTAFAALLPSLTRLTTMPDREAFEILRRECADVGVAVEFERGLPGSRITGAARWITSTKALIVLSGRYGMHDIFWFAFFHEAAHLILHPKRRVVVDLELSGDDADGQESAANEYAAAILIPEHYADQLTERTTARRAVEIADEIGVAPSIVGGRLSYLQQNWTRYARLRRKLEDLT